MLDALPSMGCWIWMQPLYFVATEGRGSGRAAECGRGGLDRTEE